MRRGGTVRFVALLLVLFIAVPIAELYVFVQAAHAMGFFTALAVLVLVSIVGAALVRREGLGVLRRLQATMGRGELPAREMVDGVLVLFAGVLLVVPGFVTDAIGLLLLLPPVRAGARFLVLRRFRHTNVMPGGVTIVDVTEVRQKPRDGGRGELGGPR